MKYKHYAPDAQVLIVKAGDWDKALLWRKNKQERVGVMAFNEVLKMQIFQRNCHIAWETRFLMPVVACLPGCVILIQKKRSTSFCVQE